MKCFITHFWGQAHSSQRNTGFNNLSSITSEKAKRLLLLFVLFAFLGFNKTSAQCTSNGVIIPTHINIAIWPNQAYMNLYPTEAIARQRALNRVNDGLAALNNLFKSRQTTFKVVFFPNTSLAPNQGGSDNPNYNIAVRNQFQQQWPCVKADIIIVPDEGSGHGFGYNNVAKISDGAMNSPQRVAHEIGHVIGLEHLEGPCGSHCSTQPTFMCPSAGEVKFAPCDINDLPGNVYTSIHCQQWMDAMDPLPDNFTCPVIPSPTIAITSDQPFLIKNCIPDRSLPTYSLTINGGPAGADDVKVRVKYLRKTFDIDIASMGMDFNNEDVSDPNYNFLRIFENGIEKTFDLGVFEEKTFHFQLLFNPDPGFTPNNLQVRPEAQLLLTNGTVKTANSGQKLYQTTNGTVNLLSFGDPIFVNGQVTFTAPAPYTLELNTPSILVSSGGSINIAANASVKSSDKFSTTIEGCTTMWQGITVNAGSKLEVDNITVKDAQDAIAVKKGGRLIASNSQFVNNNFSIKTIPSAGAGNYDLTLRSNIFTTDDLGLKPSYNGQSPQPFYMGYAGLYIKNVTNGVNIDADLESGAPNYFSNLRIGILAESSTFTLRNAHFSNILYANKPSGYPGPSALGKGIYADNCQLNVLGSGIETGDPTLTFDNVNIGIWALKSSVTVRECDMRNMATGIYASGGLSNGFVISGNNIEVAAQGIWLTSQSGLPSLSSIDNNTITTSGAISHGIGFMHNKNLTTNPSFIFGNRIILNKGITGLLINGTTLTRITDNIVTLNGPSSNKMFGIQLSGGDKNLVNCNEIYGNGQRGIYGQMASRSDFLCNTTDGADYGIYFNGVFTGDAPKIFVGDNKMYNNPVAGLLLGGNALIGEQVHNGNRWSNGGGLTIARHLGPQISSKSRFIVDPGENPEYRPDLVDPDNWFEDEDNPSDSYICNPSNDCPVPAFIVQDEQLDRLIAKGMLAGFENQEHSLWLAQRRLYRRLLYEGNQYFGDPDFDHFVDESHDASIGQFADMQQGLRDIFNLPQDVWATLDVRESGTSQYLDNLDEIEEQLSVFGLDAQDSIGLETNRSDLRSQLESLNADLGELRGVIQDSRSAEALMLAGLNSAINANAIYETNEKTVNDIYLQTVAQGIMNFTSQQLTDLQTIAGMCPFSDGEAVLDARAMLTLVESDYDVVYDDFNSCGFAFASKSISDAQAQPTSRSQVLVFPNPADQELYIRYNIEEELTTTFSLYNAVGKLIERKQLSGKSGVITLNTSTLNNGIYYYFVDGGFSGKISILH